MARVLDIEAPAHAEGTKATVLRWCRAAGETVAKDEPLLELETDKVTVEVPSPEAGVLMEILKGESAEVVPGEILARLELIGATAVSRVELSLLPAGPSAPVPQIRKPLSPAVRRMFSTYGLTSEQVRGTGRNGRITVQDISRELKSREEPGAAPALHTENTEAPPDSRLATAAGKGMRRLHSPMRRRIADHMRASMSVAPHVTTVFEADLTRVIAHRATLVAAAKRDGVPLTLSAYFVAASAKALQAVPEVNSTFHEDALEMHSDCNIGIATALGNEGLIVPVISQVHDMSLMGIARVLNQKVSAARAGKLSPPFPITVSAAAFWQRRSSSTSLRWQFSVSARPNAGLPSTAWTARTSSRSAQSATSPSPSTTVRWTPSRPTRF
jgi:2-oxoglutarate dehydrogenase E2 component (dihydrolipoamide succinyltransferase)